MEERVGAGQSKAKQFIPGFVVEKFRWRNAGRGCLTWDLTVVMRRRFEDEGHLRARHRVVVVEFAIEAMI